MSGLWMLHMGCEGAQQCDISKTCVASEASASTISSSDLKIMALPSNLWPFPLDFFMLDEK